MSGDPTNAAIWSDADVYISTDLSAALPANASTAFGVAWTLVGLLDGDAGFESVRTVDESDHYAWGSILVDSSEKNHKEMRKFTALEDNAATRTLIWPGSSGDSLIVPRPGFVKIAFETRKGGRVQRRMSTNRAKVRLAGGFTESESDLTKYTLEATIYPTSGGVLYTKQDVPAVASIAITPLTLALTTTQIKTLVATATYADATTGVITAEAAWASSNTAKATVAFGYVTGVAAGTSDISCTFGGVTSTAPCVATVS